jgi:hypothetical protein
MCRNIKTLFNFAPPATDEEIHASALQFVRKLTGFNTPAKTNQATFDLTVAQVAAAARTLLGSLTTAAPPRDRKPSGPRPWRQRGNGLDAGNGKNAGKNYLWFGPECG